MSPASYQIAPSRDINKWRRKRDSNPCADCSTSRFSRPVPSTRLGYSSKCNIYKWCLRSDSNRHELLHSQDFKSCASTYSATKAQINGVSLEIRTPDPLIKSQVLYRLSQRDIYKFLVASAGFEPAECKSQSLVPYHLATRQFQVVERHGFEPWNPKEQIYSLPRLATSLSLQFSNNKYYYL